MPTTETGEIYIRRTTKKRFVVVEIADDGSVLLKHEDHHIKGSKNNTRKWISPYRLEKEFRRGE